MTPHRAERALSSRIDRLRVRHFKLLDLIQVHGSLTAAAEALGTSQPTATKMLHEMERALRCPLVERGARGGVLTQAGLRALERLRIAVTAIDAATESATGVHGGKPLIRIGMLRLAGVSILPRVVQAMNAASCLPHMQLHEGTVTDLMKSLLAGSIDCVIGRLEAGEHDLPPGALDITALNHEPYEIACAPQHPLARRRQVRLETLAELPWITTPRDTHTRRMFDAAFTGLGLPPPVPVIESPSFHASFAILALSPSLLTVAPRSAVQYYFAMKKLCTVRLAVPFPEDRMVFITRRDLLELPAVADLKQYVADALA